MALVLADRVQQTGTANTTVSFTLSGTVTGFQSFAVVGNGNTTYYSAFDPSGNWEVGVGTYATGGTLTRTTIAASSNSGSAVTFSGSVNVFLTYPAEYAAWASNNPGTSGYVLTSNGTGVAPSWQAGGAGTITVTDFTATASQTTFTVSYTVGLAEVYQNGAKLGIADYTATSGTSIVLAVGATVGDLIEVVAFSALNLATAVNSISFGSTGLTPSSPTAGTVTVAGTLAAANGGTGNTSGQAASVANNVTFNNGGTGAASGSTYNGSGAVTVSYNTVGAQVSGTYVTSVTGTSPVASSGGTTPAISLATAYGDTLNPYASKTANFFLAAPNGTAGVPTFRAVVAADIPTLNQSTTGSAGSVANSLTAGTNITFSSGTTYNGSAAITINAATQGATITGTTTTGTYYLVGTTSTSGILSTASISNTNAVSYNASTGALTAVSHVSSSDDRLKTNWAGLDLDFVSRLQDVKHGTFERISSGNREVGVTAQSLQKLIPEAVIEDENGMLSVNYGGAALVAAIELAKVVQELRAEIKELKAELNK